MTLTLRTNGSASINIIDASWFNDFYNLLTGNMQDQNVTIQNNLGLKALGVGPSVAPSGVASTGAAGLGIGTYKYVYTWVTGASNNGETLFSPQLSVTTTSGNQHVSLSNIAVGPTGTVQRNIYRSKVGATTLFFIATIFDNITTTYSDSITDASINTSLTGPTNDTFGGTLTLQDGSGTTQLTLLHNGNILMNGKIVFAGGSLSRISQITGVSGSGAAQTTNHNLGTTPDFIMLNYAGNFGGPPSNPPYWYNANSTTITIVAQNGFFCGGIAVKL